jgi:ribonuclease HII
MAKPTPSLEYENYLWSNGIENVVGIDEVGRGSWAGPVVAGAVIFDPNQAKKLFENELKEVKDSKLLSVKKREELSEIILKNCKAFFIAEVDVETINKDGVGESTQKAFVKAFNGCVSKIPLEQKENLQSYHILIDAFFVKEIDKKIQTPIIKGDQKSYSIAAASIIAKVYRDSLMTTLGNLYKEYSFEVNKGYGTKSHQLAITKHGLSNIHRTSFNLSYLLSK